MVLVVMAMSVVVVVMTMKERMLMVIVGMIGSVKVVMMNMMILTRKTK